MSLFLLWACFLALIVGLLALDLGVFHRRDHEQTLPEALAWSGFWIALSLAFNGLVYFLYEHNWVAGGLAFPEDVSGRQAALEYFTGYVLEKSLSLDNIFVIALIFSYFKIPLRYQHRVLFWGITGALVMRGVMIGAGAVLITRFSWMTYVFGGLLLLTAARMMVASHATVDPGRSLLVRMARRLYPLTDDLREQRFFVMEGGRRAMTPLFLVLLLVEGTDLLFAVDSIPAIFAVTSDPFLVYSSNVFAILGLRSLYFALAPLLTWFRFLKASLVIVLAFVGVKMLLAHHHPIPVTVSLSIIGGVLAVGVLASVFFPTPDPLHLRSPVETERGQLFRATRGFGRRCVALVGGSGLVLLGGILLVLPPLGLKTIAVGLGVLGSHFLWARKLLGMVNGSAGRKDPPGA